MSYTLDECNFERQRLLAECLEPVTRELLRRVEPPPNARCLDLGCGQGLTTRLLADALTPAECIGIEYDQKLVEYAAGRHNPPGVRFQQGDANKLDFPDGSFDVVFTRYMLVHVPDPTRTIQEMLRVVRSGGVVIAYEPDCCYDFCYPESWAMPRMTQIWQWLFPHPNIGRELVARFRAAGATSLQAGAIQGMEHECATFRRTYRLTAEAAEPALVGKGYMTASEVKDLVEELKRVESDPETVCFKMPDMWVIASR